MSIITINTTLSIKEMRRLAYKKIFETLTYEEEKALENSIEWWPKKDPLKKEERKAVRSIVKLLLMNEDGGFGEMKEKVKELDIDYKTMYGVG